MYNIYLKKVGIICMRKIVVALLLICLLCSITTVSFAKDDSYLGEDDLMIIENALSNGVEGETGCEVIRLPIAAAKPCSLSQVTAKETRGTKPPKNFWNLGTRGIYEGEFAFASTIYTEYYFDWLDRAAFTRVNCMATLPGMSFAVGTYCVTCKSVLGVTTNYVMANAQQATGWIYHIHQVSSTHEEHFWAPFIRNTSDTGGAGTITGLIEVNYENSWD